MYGGKTEIIADIPKNEKIQQKKQLEFQPIQKTEVQSESTIEIINMFKQDIILESEKNIFDVVYIDFFNNQSIITVKNNIINNIIEKIRTSGIKIADSKRFIKKIETFDDLESNEVIENEIIVDTYTNDSSPIYTKNSISNEIYNEYINILNIITQYVKITYKI
jgi:hypothetical protein